MQIRRFVSITTAALACALAVSRMASAQAVVPNPFSIRTNAYLAAGTTTNVLSFAWDTSSTGQQVTATGSHSFTGLDSQGNQQTMTLSGTGMASANADPNNPGYFALHAYAQGTLTNPYYNANNPKYFDPTDNTNNPNGSPQYLQVVGQAVWQDTLILSPSDGVVGIRYVFGWDGKFTDYSHAYTYLAFNAGDNGTVFFNQNGETGGSWATPEWQVTGPMIGLSGNFGAVMGVNTDPIYTPEGVDVNATANLSDTLTLTGIQLLDANGNQINGAYYTTDSGLHYNVLGGIYGTNAVPEPGSVALIVGISVVSAGIGLRRKRRAL